MAVKTEAMKVQMKPSLKTWEQKTLREIYDRIKIQMAGETELMMNYNLCGESKKNRMGCSSGRSIS